MAQLVVQFTAATRISSVAFDSVNAAFCELFVSNSPDASIHSAKASTLLMPIGTLSLLPPSSADRRRHRFDAHVFAPLIAAQTWKNVIFVLTQPFHDAVIGLANLSFNDDSAGSIVVDDVTAPIVVPTIASVASTVESTVALDAAAASSSSTVKPGKKSMKDVRACFSGLVGGQRTSARKILTDLGGEYAASWDDKCTHLVATALVTSDKQTKAIAKAVPIVSPKWLDACKTAGAHVDEAPFSLITPPPPVIAEAESSTKRAASSPPPSPVVKKPKLPPTKATAATSTKTPTGPYERAVDGGKKLVKTPSNRYILEDVGAVAAAATTESPAKADLTDELTEPIAADLIDKAVSKSASTTTPLGDDRTVPLADARLGKGAPLHELPDLFGRRRVFFHFADPLAHASQRLRSLARAFGAQLDDFVEDETAFLITDRAFDSAMAGAREDNEELQVVDVSWLEDSLRAGRLLLPVAAKHRAFGDTAE
jgi:hypothetical protein